MRLFRKTSVKVILLGFPVMVIILFFGTAYWLLNTSSGAAWLWNSLQRSAVIDVRASQVSGNLASGFVIQDMAYRSAGLDLLVQRAEVKAGMAWWPLSVEVGRLVLQDVNVVTRSSAEPEAGAETDGDIRAVLAGLELPVAIVIDDAELTRIKLQGDDGPVLNLFESILFRGEMDKRLVVDQLEVRAADFEASLQGFLQLQPPFELSVSSQGRLDSNRGVRRHAVGGTVQSGGFR